MSQKRIYIFVNGIMCRPGDSHNWNSRAVTWIHRHTGDRAEKLEYFCGPVSRAFFQKWRAEKLANLIRKYEGWEIVLVGHSNGTAIILLTLALMEWPQIKTVHLVSAACERDFKKNGLNAAITNQRIGKVFVWMSGKDSALHVAKRKIGRLLGYGTLGLDGPKDAIDASVILWAARDHSDCFKSYNFEATMRGFLQEPV